MVKTAFVASILVAFAGILKRIIIWYNLAVLSLEEVMAKVKMRVAWAQPGVSFYCNLDSLAPNALEAIRDIKKLEGVSFASKDIIRGYKGVTVKVTLNADMWWKTRKTLALLHSLQRLFNASMIYEEIIPVTLEKTRIRRESWLNTKSNIS